MPLGYQFSPDQQTRLRSTLNSSLMSPQGYGALRVLSLHLPNVLGGRPVSPDDLLRSQPGGGSAGPSAVVSSNLRSPAPNGDPRASAGPVGSRPGANEGAQLIDLINNAISQPGQGVHVTPGDNNGQPAAPGLDTTYTPPTGGNTGVGNTPNFDMADLLSRLRGGGGSRF